MLDISTAHISQETSKILAENSPDNYILSIPFEYGWIVYANELFEGDKKPEDLRTVIKYAQRKGCEWIKLDSDGDLVPELPEYEW